MYGIYNIKGVKTMFITRSFEIDLSRLERVVATMIIDFDCDKTMIVTKKSIIHRIENLVFDEGDSGLEHVWDDDVYEFSLLSKEGEQLLERARTIITKEFPEFMEKSGG